LSGVSVVAAGDDDRISIRDHFERLFVEHQRAHRAEQESTLRALDAARGILETRMDGLVEADRRVADEVAGLRREQERGKGQRAALAAVGAVLLIVVPIVLQLLNIGRP